MRASQTEIATILANQGGVIARRDHPELLTALEWLRRRHALTAVLPGIYAPPAVAGERHVRIRAAMLWAPEAVLTGPAAASVSFWSNIKVDDITLAVGDRRTAPAGYQLSRRWIPPELFGERQGIRFTIPALTALDLCATFDGDGIDTALRARAATLSGMRHAMDLSPYREGNLLRRRLLLDSRDNPWSAAERLGHRLLRDAGITGWKGNLSTVIHGHRYFIDIAFEHLMLAIEIDGRLHEDDLNLFESDRYRQNALVLQGWRVLRFTWQMLTEHPDVVIQTVLEAIELQSQPAQLRPARARRG